MSDYLSRRSDDELRAIARQWDDDGADGETIHALTREVIRLRSELAASRSELAQLRQRNAELVELLRIMEWRPNGECPCCLNSALADHAPDCRLRAALEGR
jgi:hypothetical protein